VRKESVTVVSKINVRQPLYMYLFRVFCSTEVLSLICILVVYLFFIKFLGSKALYRKKLVVQFSCTEIIIKNSDFPDYGLF